jgi:hypothetical protein
MRKTLFATAVVLLPIVAGAMNGQEQTIDGLRYRFLNNGTKCLLGPGDMGSIPESLIVRSDVGVIDEDCFDKDRHGRKITAPRSVTFESDSKLVKIGGYAFEDAHIETIQIPASVEHIGKYCFFRCKSLCEVTFEPGSRLRIIDSVAFGGTNIKSVRIPASVEHIGNGCFSDCRNLREVTSEPDSGLKAIGDYAFDDCASLIRVEIRTAEPIGMGESCFRGCDNLREIDCPGLLRPGNGQTRPRIPGGITCLGKGLFSRICLLQAICIPSNVTIIERACFYECYNLREVTFEDGTVLGEIKDAAFSGCRSLERIQIPKSVEIIGDRCFEYCRALGEVTFERGSRLREIGNEVFNGTALKAIEIPEEVELMGVRCFEGLPGSCQITSGPGLP